MRLEEKDLGRGAVACANRELVQVVEFGGAGLRKVGKGEVDEVIACELQGAGEDVVGAVNLDNNGVFNTCEAAPVVFRADKRAGGGPGEVGGKGANLAGVKGRGR